jgi:hypothetical protein
MTCAATQTLQPNQLVQFDTRKSTQPAPLPRLTPSFTPKTGQKQQKRTNWFTQPPTTNMNITISFTPEGTAQCLWTEALPLHELGWLEVSRASNIEFNNSTQHWEVKDRRGKVRFIARSRSACLEWEQTNLQPE